MSGLSPTTLRLIQKLSNRASLCASLFVAWERLPFETPVGVRELTGAAGLSVSEELGAEEVLHTLAELSLVTPAGRSWRPSKAFHQSIPELAIAFNAIEFYLRAVHKDETHVQVSLTRPEQSVALAKQLLETGWRIASTDETDQSFKDLVQRAETRIVVMTPFLDEHGATWLKELFGEVPATVETILILRSLDDPARWDYPKGFPLLRDWLRERRTKVFNYSILRETAPGRETFHAKVILADSDFAYVGSANMTVASLETSLEMGVVLEGRAAREVSYVVNAILKCAAQWAV